MVLGVRWFLHLLRHLQNLSFFEFFSPVCQCNEKKSKLFCTIDNHVRSICSDQSQLYNIVKFRFKFVNIVANLNIVNRRAAIQARERSRTLQQEDRRILLSLLSVIAHNNKAPKWKTEDNSIPLSTEHKRALISCQSAPLKPIDWIKLS
jgi:hypothetical protein